MAQQTISKMETVQTAVEWLENQIKSIDIGSGIKMKIDIPKEFLEKAKQMEKEQIKMAITDWCFLDGIEDEEHYYNLKYGTK